MASDREPSDREPPDPAVDPAAALAAVCDAAGSLLARAPAPMTRLRVRYGDITVDLSWPQVAGMATGSSTGTTDSAASVSVAPASVVGEEVSLSGPPEAAYIRAPMVGTFYHAPEPDAAPFVQVGDLVEAGQQVGILEAMKLMNPVEAERSGRVVEVLVPDAAPVEYDQRLITIDASGGDG